MRKKTKVIICDDADVQDSQEGFNVDSKPINTRYRCEIDKTFLHTSQFSQVVATLEDAQDGDVVEIKLSTNGGNLQSVLPLLGAMRNTKATVNVHVVSDVS